MKNDALTYFHRSALNLHDVLQVAYVFLRCEILLFIIDSLFSTMLLRFVL